MPACDKIGGDPGAGQPLKRLAQTGIAAAAGFAVGGQHQIMRGQPQLTPDGTACIDRRHQLTDAIDQDVFVKQRGQPAHRRHHSDLHPVVGIVQNAPVGARGQREQRMLHRGHVILGQCIKNIADKKIAAMPVGGQPALPRNTLAFARLIQLSLVDLILAKGPARACRQTLSFCHCPRHCPRPCHCFVSSRLAAVLRGISITCQPKSPPGPCRA